MNFPEFLLSINEFTLFEQTSFCQDVFNKLSPEDREQFVQFIKDSNPVEIMRLIKKVHKGKYKKGKKE